MLVRLGQHNGFTTYPRLKYTPFSSRSLLTVVIGKRLPMRMSSVRMIRTFGFPASAAAGPSPVIALSGEASSPRTATSPRNGVRSHLGRGGGASLDVRGRKGRKTRAGYRLGAIFADPEPGRAFSTARSSRWY